MDFFIISVILIIIAWILNYTLGIRQIRRFNNGYLELRKKGKVAIGRKKGYFSPGAIILFLIEEDGVIIEGKKMHGSSVMANLKPFNDFNTYNILSIDDQLIFKYPKSIRKALLDSKNNFKFFLKEEELDD